MAASIISISNRALLSIGSRSQISSLTEGSTEANAISVLFTPTFEMLGRTAWWNCLRFQTTLSLLKAAQGTPENPSGTLLPLPPTPWLYSYALPSNCLHARFIVPTMPPSLSGGIPFTSVSNNAGTWLPTDGQIPFVVAYDTDASGSPITVILTNQTQAQLVYTINQGNPAIWDSAFQQAMVSSLAAYLVPALSLDLQLMQMSISTAERIISEARSMDANEGYSSQNREASWMTARTGSAFIYGNGFYGANFGTMNWPSA